MKYAKIRALVSAFLLGFAIQNCGGTTEDLQRDTDSTENGKSQIEVVEQELGVSLVKEFKTITDEHGNSVNLLVASQQQEVVNDFLARTDIYLEMIDTTSTSNVDSNGIDVPSANAGKEQLPNSRRLMLEVVSKSFGPETKAFTLQFRGKDEYQPNSVTPLSLATYESEMYVEGFKITYLGFNCGTCTGDITVQHWSRQCALCSYKLFASQVLSPGQYWQSCNDARRTKAVINGMFPASYYSWNFTFWNCA